MNLTRVWSTFAVCSALLACGDDGDSKEPQEQDRATILNSSAAMIAASALADTPSQDFVVARGRVEAKVSAPDRSHVRATVLGAGKAAAVVTDPLITTTRRSAAQALGATLDPAKEADVNSAQQSLDALLGAIQAIAPQATSCDMLPSGKAEACAIAFLILEVRRSEGALAVPDAGTDAATVDSGVPTAGSINCPTVRDVTGATMVTSSVNMDQTWSGKVLVTGSVYVSNAKITIAPGTQIYMDTDASIYFAYTGSAGLFANGTADQPITICGRTADKGFWSKITIGDNVTSDSYLRNVLIAEGGGDSTALQVDGNIEVTNLQVADSGKDGVTAKAFKAGSTQLSVRNAGGYPLVLTDQVALARVPQGGTFAGNTSNQISLTLTSIASDVTVHNLGVPYVQQSSIYQNSGNLVIEAGVEWRLKSDTGLSFAYLDSSSVNMQGTAAAPIKFLAVDANSQWGRLIFYDKVNSNSVLSYVEISGGGRGNDSAVQLDTPIKLDHVSLKQNASGLQVSNKGLAAGSAALTITGTQARPLTVDLEGVYTLPADSTLTGNTIDQVELTSGTFQKTGTIPALGVPYHLTNSYYDGNNVSVTIAAGAQFVVGADTLIYFGYYGGNTVTIAGTAAKPITFRGEQALAGFWRGLTLGTSALTNSKLDYVEISDAGGGGGAALKLDAAVAVTHTKISNSSGYCIDGLRSAMIDYTLTNTLTCVTPGVSLH